MRIPVEVQLVVPFLVLDDDDVCVFFFFFCDRVLEDVLLYDHSTTKMHGCGLEQETRADYIDVIRKSSKARKLLTNVMIDTRSRKCGNILYHKSKTNPCQPFFKGRVNHF